MQPGIGRWGRTAGEAHASCCKHLQALGQAAQLRHQSDGPRPGLPRWRIDQGVRRRGAAVSMARWWPSLVALGSAGSGHLALELLLVSNLQHRGWGPADRRVHFMTDEEPPYIRIVRDRLVYANRYGSCTTTTSSSVQEASVAATFAGSGAPCTPPLTVFRQPSGRPTSYRVGCLDANYRDNPTGRQQPRGKLALDEAKFRCCASEDLYGGFWKFA